MDKKTFIIFILLATGFVFRIFLTSGGNFIFHMDNARDMIDIREMVVLHKWRLISSTSGIEGLFTGPAWYYVASIPFIITQGDPYSLIVLQIIFWAIGGFFLLRLAKSWGMEIVIFLGSLWIASNLIILNSQHSLNPNPIILLMPLLIYLMEKFLKEGSILINAYCWVLVGFFFQLNMAYGFFLPIIVVLSTIIFRRKSSLRFLAMGVVIFVLNILPQVIFDFRHNFLMVRSVASYLSSAQQQISISKVDEMSALLNLYKNIYYALFMNWNVLIWTTIFLTAFLVRDFTKKHFFKNNILITVCLLIVVIPFLGFFFSPARVTPWYVQGSGSAALILIGFALYQMKKLSSPFNLLIYPIVGLTMIYAIFNMKVNYLDKANVSQNPTLLRSELAAIDYVYTKAEGKNFKVYVYLPSVIDYPYQYLFWWYGQRKYGYLPADYAYLPEKPEYISSKSMFSNGKNPPSSQKIFLIKQPDDTGIRHLWENSFTKLPLVSTIMVGSIEIEERREIYPPREDKL